jgi:exodeoxyribonuclease-5
MSALTPNNGQAAALEMIGKFLKDDEHRVAVLTGYAGTGKTSLLRMISDTYGYPTILAPTGKAAVRAGEATGLGASTIHRWLYTADTDPETGGPVFVLKDVWDFIDFRGKLIVVDEASMVDKKVWTDLNYVANKARFHILLVGDTAQLPPITKDKSEYFNTLDTVTPYRHHLSEIHRQALGSPIIKASMILRSKRPYYDAMGLLTPVPASKLIETMMETRNAGGVTICHTNRRRHWLNNQIRGYKCYGDAMEDGEPLLVLQNQYAIDHYNGEIVDFNRWSVQPTLNQIVSDRFTVSTKEMNFGVGVVDGSRVMLSPEEINGSVDGSGIGLWSIRRHAKYAYDTITLGEEDKAPPYLHCNFGYALSCHKSQGSQWPEVLLVLDGSIDRMRVSERNHWLYTAITRSQEKCSYAYLPDLDWNAGS